MFYVTCPLCGSQVEIPADAIGPKRTDPWNVTRCDDCDCSFDYDDEEIVSETPGDDLLDRTPFD